VKGFGFNIDLPDDLLSKELEKLYDRLNNKMSR